MTVFDSPVRNRPPLPLASGQDVSVGELGLAYRQISRRLLVWLVPLLALLGLILLASSPDRFVIYLVCTLPTLLILLDSSQRAAATLPIFPIYVVLQALTFIAPLFAQRLLADRQLLATPAMLSAAGLPLLLWFLALWLGWSAAPPRWGLQPPAPSLTQPLARPGFLPHVALALSIALQFWLNSPSFWLIPELGRALLSPLRILSGLTATIGAFTGAYAWSRGRLSSRLLWLILLVFPIAFSLRSLLLSNLQALFFAVLLGLWLGRSRQALSITLIGLLLAGFLNLGKAEIRSVYWSSGASSGAVSTNPIQLVQQWSEASLRALSTGDVGVLSLFTDRFNNLQNLLYVQNQLSAGTPTLDGRSFSVIPATLVPRFLTPDKVRSQEGQVILNLHFNRQSDRFATETTYIAWGLLAEGVGNFGAWLGPLLVGIPTGLLLRVSETLGRGQLVLSTPGLLSFAVGILWFTSYEMAASTLVAAAFQLIVMVLFLGWWFTRRPSA